MHQARRHVDLDHRLLLTLRRRKDKFTVRFSPWNDSDTPETFPAFLNNCHFKAIVTRIVI